MCGGLVDRATRTHAGNSTTARDPNRCKWGTWGLILLHSHHLVGPARLHRGRGRRCSVSADESHGFDDRRQVVARTTLAYPNCSSGSRSNRRPPSPSPPKPQPQHARCGGTSTHRLGSRRVVLATHQPKQKTAIAVGSVQHCALLESLSGSMRRLESPWTPPSVVPDVAKDNGHSGTRIELKPPPFGAIPITPTENPEWGCPSRLPSNTHRGTCAGHFAWG